MRNFFDLKFHSQPHFMATIVRALRLAVCCNDRALLARCPRHIQSVFLNTKLDSGHPCYGQLTAVKRKVIHWRVGLGPEYLIVKETVLWFRSHRQVRLCSVSTTSTGPLICNLVRSVIIRKSQTSAVVKASVWDIPVMTLLSVNK